MKRRSLVHLAMFCMMMGFFTGQANAVCEEALIMATYRESTTLKSDWRLAKFVSEEAYNKAKEQSGAKGTIFGVKIGTNYDKYTESYKKREQRHNEVLTHEEAKHIMWAGLTTVAAAAYGKCLDNQVFNSPGLHIAVVRANEYDIHIKVKWFIPGITEPAQVIWTEPSIGGKLLLTKFAQGETVISVPRPSRSIGLTANFRGYASETVTLLPLPQQLPKKVERSCKEYRALPGKSDYAACNSETDPGYYWKVIQKIGPYYQGGATPTGLPACDEDELGATAYTTRYPPAHAFFLDVGSAVNTAGAPQSNAQCGSAICGRFIVLCSKQE